MNAGLIQQILKLEFSMFQKVHNRGGRASCQDDLTTFQIMRSSQFSAWSMELLQSYLQDLATAERSGQNLVALKYAWMMEDTFPLEFDEIRETLPPLSLIAQSTIREILSLQMPMTESLFCKYPNACARSRSLRPVAAHPHIASIQTYLRGELCTYSERTLFLYLRNLQMLATMGQNLAELILESTAKQYGYPSLLALESSLASGNQSPLPT